MLCEKLCCVATHIQHSNAPTSSALSPGVNGERWTEIVIICIIVYFSLYINNRIYFYKADPSRYQENLDKMRPLKRDGYAYDDDVATEREPKFVV